MRRINLFIIVATLLAFAGCDSSSSYDDGGYSDIYPGILIYNQARTTNNIALDPLSVALRFRVLLAEMEKEGVSFSTETYGIEPDWAQMGDVDYTFATQELNKKLFLFGDDASVEILNTAENIYTIIFGNALSDVTLEHYGTGVYDNYYRAGGYTITRDPIVDQWSVEIESNGLSIAQITTYNEVSEISALKCKSITSTIDFSTLDDDGKISFSTNCQVNRNTAGTEYSDWDCVGTLEISEYEDMLLENTLDREFYLTLNGLTAGTSLWGSQMSYTTSEPLLYAPNRSFLDELSGVEVATIFNVSSSKYPSPTVRLTQYEDGTRIISYDGATYSL